MQISYLYIRLKESNCSTLCVITHEGVAFQLKYEGLWEGTEWGCNPGYHQHDLRLAAGPVGDGEHDGRETVQGDDNKDEAREIESENSEEDHHSTGNIVGHPRHSRRPCNLQWNLYQDDLITNTIQRF